jgi:hypothetical protein
MLLVTPELLKRGGLLEFDTLDVNDPQICRRIGDIGPTMLIIPSFDWNFNEIVVLPDSPDTSRGHVAEFDHDDGLWKARSTSISESSVCR